ncbi:peptide-methionine (R)-S-oxide reductase MsrB [Halanaerobium salsuginis]|uniref:Peptide methionine sulfoxide reductase MsrA n=1 Tax=Halanaerobium salsuginis TaxID=29563 RepID=A0A1I4IBS3_9FIRM|nr:peptide methionine sulfoxide reductase msrA/msrB [Halanaerobium salsuginis]
MNYFLTFLTLSFIIFIYINPVSAFDYPNYDKRLANKEFKTATFSLGCFWGPDASFGALPGVIKTRVGYAGGTTTDPNYQIIGDQTETIQIDYDPAKISYQELLEKFFVSHNAYAEPYSSQYASKILYHNQSQQKAALAFKEKLETKTGQEIKTEIKPLKKFYLAENYHQKFRLQQHKEFKKYYLTQMSFNEFLNSPTITKLNAYLAGKGKEEWLLQNLNDLALTNHLAEQLLKINKIDPAACTNLCQTKPAAEVKLEQKDYSKKSDLKTKLNDLEYKVTQLGATEPAFNNRYWNHKEAGIYVDVVSGEALFASTDKFQSGSGWPSFTKPLVTDNLIEETDNSLWMQRTEVKSKKSGSHLGHVFADGPEPTGLRYCINSAALKFIPAAKLEENGYGKFKYLFKKEDD